MLRRSSARCQPGLNCRWPSTPTRAARSRSSPSWSSACFHLALLADDADQVVHGLLQFLVQRCTGSPPCRCPRRTARAPRRPPRRRSASAHRGTLVARGPRRTRRRVQPGPAAEDQQVGERVAAEPVGAVHAAGDLTGREQAGHAGGRRGVGVDLDAAHHVVAGRADLHRLGGDVDVGQLLELVVHRRQPPEDLLGGQPGRDVEEHAAVRRAAAGLDLGVDRPGHLVAGQQLGRAPVVCPGRRTSGRPPPRSPRTSP